MESVEERERGLLHTAYVKLMWLARHQGLVLGILIGVLAGVWAFVAIASEVVEGDTKSFDEWAVRSLRQKADPAEPLGPHWLKIAALDASAMGGTVVLALITLLVGIFLGLSGKAHAMWLVWVSVGGGQILSSVLKNVFDRPRPNVVPHLSEVMTASFPSGHSLMSAVVYLTLGALLAQFVLQRRAKVYVFAVALFLTGMVGLTRIYLGVHYPTDVLAGWTAGAVWALLCWGVAQHLQRRGKVEPPGDVEG